MNDENLMFAHSGCCGAHWELVYNPDTGKYGLLCENCGEPLVGLEITGPVLDSCDCSACRKKQAESN